MCDDEDGAITLSDDAGCTMTLYRYQGRLWPTFSPKSIAGVNTLKVKDNDVFLVAFPKSGNHWLREIIRLLILGRVDVPLEENSAIFVEKTDPDIVKAAPSPRLLNTHAHFELIPPDVLTNARKCKLVHVTRDPRDLAVSFYNHKREVETFYNYYGQWKDYLPMFMDGRGDYESWFTHTKGWEEGIENHPELQVHVTSYEALQRNPLLETEKLAKFLGTVTDKPFLEEVVKKTGFIYMKENHGPLEMYPGKASRMIYRKGQVGDWKNWFTVTQSEQFDDVFEKEMAGTKAYDLYSNRKRNFTKTTYETNGNSNFIRH